MKGLFRVVALTVGVFALGACDTDSPQELAAPILRPHMLYTVGDLTDATTAGEVFKVCKYGSAAVINVTETGDNVPGGVVNRQVNVADGECRTVSVVYPRPNGNSPTVNVTVSEVVGNPFQLDSIRVLTGPATVSSTLVLTNSATAAIGGSSSTVGRQGAVAKFYNSQLPPPPPPPGGGEGCTPGYWKQNQHFGNWVGYSPNQLFSSVFEDAFPGKTLLQVLRTGGGGLEALGRHTVAALLNASNPNVDYDVTAAEIIADFNAVFPGGDYETLKNELVGYNEQGCPIGRS